MSLPPVDPNALAVLRARNRKEHEASFYFQDTSFDRAAVKVLPGEYFVYDHDVAISTTLGSCVAACLRGAGIVLQPDFLIARDLAAGHLVELMPQYRSLELGIYAVYPTRKHVPAKVRALVDFLMAHFLERGPSW